MSSVSERPRLVVFSPLPPVRNGIADYTANLLHWLSATYDCICVAADDAPAPELGDTAARILYASEYVRQAPRLAAERHLYQMGNNAGHAYMLPWLERVPGVTTLHDASLAHLMAWLSPAGLATPAFQGITRAAHGPAGVSHLEAVLALRCGIGQELTYLGPVARASRAVVVHSRLAELRTRAASPGTCVHVIPCFAFLRPPAGREQPGDSAADSARARSVHLLCLGFVTRSKRIDLVLAAMALLRRDGHDVRLTIAGEVRAEEYDVEADIAALDLGAQVVVTGYLDDEQMEAEIAAADILINLRDPTSGESSGPLLRALGAGVCSVVTDVGTFAELPDEAVVKVGRVDMTPEGLALRLWRPVTDVAYRTGVAARGRAYMAATASLERVARCYVDAIEATYAPARRRAGIKQTSWLPARVVLAPATEAERIAAWARSTGVSIDVHGLWWRQRLLPRAGDAYARLLVAGGGEEEQRLASEAFGWQRVRGCAGLPGALRNVAEKEPAFDAVLFLSTGAAWEQGDPRRLLAAVCACLQPRATLTIELLAGGTWSGLVQSYLCELGFHLVTEFREAGAPSLQEADPLWRAADDWCATFLRPAEGHAAGFAVPSP